MMYMTGASLDEAWPLIRDFHYSRKMPSIPKHCFAWRKEGGLFGDFGEPLAIIVYGQPVNRNWPIDAIELQRLARRDDFDGALSQFVSWSLRWLRSNTSYPFALSYADSGQDHHGGIYQATNWKYVWESAPGQNGVINKTTGEFIHGRTCYDRFGSRSQKTLLSLPGDFELAYSDAKYLYAYPLRQRLKPMLKRFGWQELPYPKPNAARPVDELFPNSESVVQPHGAAPIQSDMFAEVSR